MQIMYLSLLDFVVHYPECIAQIHSQYIHLLQQLSPSSSLLDSDTAFVNLVRSIYFHQGHICVAVAIDDYACAAGAAGGGATTPPAAVLPQIVGTATIMVEQKILRGGKCVAHVEDVVVDSQYRGRKIAAQMMEYLAAHVNTAFPNKIYKILLDCSEDNVGIYEKLGFKNCGAYMAKYL